MGSTTVTAAGNSQQGGGGSSFTNSGELSALLTDETGTGAAVFANSPTLSTLTVDNTKVIIGTELITNGNFTGGTTGWTLWSDVVYGTNNVISTYTGGNPSVSTIVPLIAGNSYVLSFSATASPEIRVFFNGAFAYDFLTVGTGNHSFNFTSTVTGNGILYFDQNDYIIGDSFTLDNVSIKQIEAVTPLLTLKDNVGNTQLNLTDSFGVGYNSLVNTTATGYSNIAIGASSLEKNIQGHDNIAIGAQALQNNIDSQNIGIGNGSLKYITGGSYYNTALGSYAGYYTNSGNRLTSAVNCTYIGAYSSTFASGSTNEIVIGSDAFGLGSNSVVLGSAAVTKTALQGKIGISMGTNSPTNDLSFNGNVARTIWSERHTTANTAGNNLTIQAGGATAAATDKNGGQLILKGGTSTGTGSSGVTLQGYVAGTSGTADRTAQDMVKITGNTLGFYNATPVVKPTALTTGLTTVTFTAPGTPDYAVQDLTNVTPYGFASQDEGNTVLSVIANLQTRVGQLESKLQALGLLT